MTETAGLTVFIDGDISGLTEAIGEAQARIDALSSYTSVGYGGGDFVTARRRYRHWAKSGDRSVDEQIKWWQDAMDIFSWDETVQWEARENIYKLNRQKAKDINDLYGDYIDGRGYFVDIAPDSHEAVRVFNEIKQLNKDFANDGILTWKEYNDSISQLGSDMYEGRIKASEDWLKHEEKYNRLSIDDYVSGLERMDSYTQEYFANGLISYKEYLEGREYIADEIARKYAEEYSTWKNNAEAWQSDRNLFNDWKENGDSTLDYYDRVNGRIEEFYQLGKISWDTMNADMAQANRELFKIKSQGDEVYKAWEKNAENWKKLRDTFGDWQAFGDSAVQFYSRCIERVSQMYNEGHITWQKYMDDTMEYEMQLFKAEESALDSVLKSMSSYIDEMQDKYKKQEQSLKEEWDVNDRADRQAEVNAQLAIYRNAVTETGKNKYKSLLDEQKKLSREEELYNLQKDNNAAIDKLNEQYKIAEKNKDGILKTIYSSNVSIADVEKSIGIDFAQFGRTTEDLLVQLINAVNNSARYSNSGSYTDNRTIRIATGVSANQVWGIINGTTVSGLGSVMYNGTRYSPMGG